MSYNLSLLLQSVLQYGSKLRMIRVLTLDQTLRTLLVDESLPLADITRNVCAKIGKEVVSYNVL